MEAMDPMDQKVRKEKPELMVQMEPMAIKDKKVRQELLDQQVRKEHKAYKV